MSKDFDTFMPTNAKTLEPLGLSAQEAQVYLALLKIGGARASRIARETGFKRTTAYAILKNLSRKGFVTLYYRKSQQFYYAVKPARVATLFEKKLNAFTTLIPTLESLAKKETRDMGLRFIETKQELEEFYRGVLQDYHNRAYRIIGSAAGWEGLDPDFFIQFRKDRAAHRIRTRLLLTADSKSVSPKAKILKRDVRFLSEKYPFRSTMDIYDDKVLIVSAELSSLAVVIEIPAMVDVFQSIFEMLWDATPSKITR